MTIALLSIGTEITRGELNNTNAYWLAEDLTSRGYTINEMVTVDDDDTRIIDAVQRLIENHETIICTGGLGPTTDDRTTECAARAFDLPLVQDEESLETIKILLKNRGLNLSNSNAKQANFPKGAIILKNSRGSAPGFCVQFGTKQAFFMPGVPYEMRPMFRESVVPRLIADKNHVACIRLRTFGMPEAQVGDLLHGLEEKHQITIGYRAAESEIEVKVLARSLDAKDAHRRAETTISEIRRLLGSAVYTRGTSSLPQVVGDLLLAQNSSLGLAESCTGGLVSQLITSVSGASAYFRGGICSYDNSIKEALLSVSKTSLATEGAVSESVARQMAEGAKRTLRVDYALAITGVAGPSGGTEEKPVGLVHFALATSSKTISEFKHFRGDRMKIQRRAAMHGLWIIHSALASQA